MNRDGGRGRDGLGVGAALEVIEAVTVRAHWHIDRWSEEACEFARRAAGLASDAEIGSALFRALRIPPEIAEDLGGNLLLNEGIAEMLDLMIAAGGTTAYNNANAEIGVGDSATAAAATQTDLQAGSNFLFKAMVATYPIRTGQTVDFRSDFTTGEANFAWQEASVRNGNTRNRNLNRKVQSLGTKVSGTWTLTASITIS